jgi:hypothetical protein
MSQRVNLDDIRLNFDPIEPQERFRAAGVRGAMLTAEQRMPSPVPWPDHALPKAVPLRAPPSETDDLARFGGADVVVLTWSVAETAALAALLTPGYPLSTWYEYRNGVPAYLPLISGDRAPFNDATPDMARSFRSLGQYFPLRIGAAKVLLFKSGLHFGTDGTALAVKRLIQDVARTVKPGMIITTGTGGGIGPEMRTGDIVLAGQAKFECQTQFKAYPWRNAVFRTSTLPPGVLGAITPQLTTVNASRLPGARPVPKIWASTLDTVVTTDFSGFDDSTNFCGLQGKGRLCDDSDAVVGQALSELPGIDWYSIRSVSDPQIPNPSGDFGQATQEAADIYSSCAALAAASSVIATWAVIAAVVATKRAYVSSGTGIRPWSRPGAGRT